MEKISPLQRELNLFTRAVEQGFEFGNNDNLGYILSSAKYYLLYATSPDKYEYCNVRCVCGYESYTYSDGKGYEVTMYGDIIGNISNWKERFIFRGNGRPERIRAEYADQYEESFIFFDKVIDSLGNVIQLYC